MELLKKSILFIGDSMKQINSTAWLTKKSESLKEKAVSNAQKFLYAFNKIEQYLKKIYGSDKHIDVSSLVRELSERNNLIRTYSEELRQYAKLRNAIVHQTTDKPIAEPYDETVEYIQRIYEAMTKPPTAYQIASKPVECCNTEDLIVEVVKEMTEKDYTCVPVYDGDKFVGVFSESSITKWLGESAEKDGFLLEQIKIGDLKKYFDLLHDSFRGYEFVPKNTNVFDVQEKFLSFTAKQRRLAAIFVTENGRKEEKILGMITAWDLPKIKKLWSELQQTGYNPKSRHHIDQMVYKLHSLTDEGVAIIEGC